MNNMIVAMLQVILHLPEGLGSIKEKRRILNSLKQRLRNTFPVSVAEVDLHESMGFTQIGIALVTNSFEHGRSVLRRIELFLEREGNVSIYDLDTHCEEFGS